MYKEKLAHYGQLVESCDGFDRKGKTMPYTSANGHMFSFLNKNGDLGFRFSKEIQEKYIKEWNSSHVVSHGAIMKGYLLVTNEMMNDLDQLKEYQLESCEYVKTLAPK